MTSSPKLNGRLLIVDDEPEIRELLHEALSSIAAEVEVAVDGQEAYEKIKTGQFTTVLSDIKMPRLSGLELLAKLRAENNFIPFIILTAYGDLPKTLEALKNGAMDFLDKPWKDEVLIEVVNRALELGQEMHRWGSEESAIAGLEDIRSESSEEAIHRLNRINARLAQELVGLKKKLDHQGKK